MNNLPTAEDPFVPSALVAEERIGGPALPISEQPNLLHLIDADKLPKRLENAQKQCEGEQLGEQFATIFDALTQLEPEKRLIVQDSFATIIEKTTVTKKDDALKTLSKKTLRNELLMLLSSGFRYGEQAMDKFSDPMFEAVDPETGIAKIEDQTFFDDLTAAKKQFRSSFIHTYARAIPVFATSLVTDGKGLTQDIFTNSKRYNRQIGYQDAGDVLSEALEALELTTLALQSIAESGKATTVIEVNPGDKETGPSHTYVLEQPEKSISNQTSVHIRPRYGLHRIHGEYGHNDVDGSVSFNVDLRKKDPRRAEHPSNSLNTPATDYRRRSDRHFTETESLSGALDNRANDYKFLKYTQAQETMSEISIRFDFEKRGLSLDIGSILSDADGFSFVVGNLFGIGDVLISRILNRESTYNHSTRHIDQSKWMEDEEAYRGNTFAFLAQSLGWSVLRDQQPRYITIKEWWLGRRGKRK